MKHAQRRQDQKQTETNPPAETNASNNAPVGVTIRRVKDIRDKDARTCQEDDIQNKF